MRTLGSGGDAAWAESTLTWCVQCHRRMSGSQTTFMLKCALGMIGFALTPVYCVYALQQGFGENGSMKRPSREFVERSFEGTRRT